MRRLISLVGLAAVAGCTDPAPTETPGGTRALSPTLSAGSEGSPPIAVFNTQLRAENEPNGASTSESKGHAQVKVFADGTIRFTLVINNNKGGETFHRAHIHKAPAGVNGGIHWDFLEAGNPVASIGGHPSTLQGVARARTFSNPNLPSLADLLANPAGYYVNVHSLAFPGGAIRGQLR
jgi:hypothetical protein